MMSVDWDLVSTVNAKFWKNLIFAPFSRCFPENFTREVAVTEKSVGKVENRTKLEIA